MGEPTRRQPTATGPTLRWRIVVVLLLASLLPLVLAVLAAWGAFADLIEAKAVRHMRTLVEGHAGIVEANLQQHLHLMQLLARSQTLTQLRDEQRLEQLLTFLNHFENTGFVDLGVIDAAGNHLAYVGPYDLDHCNYREAEWFRQVMADGVFISDVFLGYRRVPHFVVAVKSTDRGQPWILRATVNSERFDSLVRTTNLGQDADVFIVDRKGRYQTTPRNGALLDPAPVSDLSFHRDVRDRRIESDSASLVEVTTWLNRNRWLLVVRRDLDAVRAPVAEAITRAIRLVTVAVAVLIVVTFFATRHLTARIDKANAERDEMTRAFHRSAKLASVGELATGLAHEINNPLAVISAEQTNIDDLLRETEPDPARDAALKSVERIGKQVQRCSGITRRMLQFGGNRESTVEPTDLVALSYEVVEFLHRPAAERDVRIDCRTEGNPPPVLADPVEFEQVLVNLVNNALDAMPHGGCIEIVIAPGPGSVHLEVRDTGTGIDPDTMERIFEPFFTNKPPGRGTGLGLSICYGIVQSWGGRIEAESQPGRGTTVRIVLPRADNPETTKG